MSEYRSGLVLGEDAFRADRNFSSSGPLPLGSAATAAPYSPLAAGPAAATAVVVPVLAAELSPTKSGFHPRSAACLRTSAVWVLSVPRTTASGFAAFTLSTEGLTLVLFVCVSPVATRVAPFAETPSLTPVSTACP